MQSVWLGKMARRQWLRRAGGMGLGLSAAYLAACGGSDDKSGAPATGGSSGGTSGGAAAAVVTPPPGLLAKPEDSSAKAVSGGVFKSFEIADIEGMDPHRSGSARTMAVATFAYQRLLKNKTSFTGQPTSDVAGDLAESWEFNGDGTQITFKLRPGVTWDKRAPTSGRAVDSQDVKWSADRFLAMSSYATNYFNSKSKAAPVLSLETPDARTVVMKLAFPYMPLLATFTRALNMWILPREADGGFDPKTDARGSGPWILDSYKPSVGLEFKRNPDYYEKGKPYLEGWSAPIVPEYAQRLAQFRAGNIWAGAPAGPAAIVKQEDVLDIKKDLPNLVLFQTDYGIDTPSLFFGFQGPFKDVRLRQALSLLLDRPLIAETISDSAKFEKAGLPKALRINSFIGAGWSEWVDPTSADFGPNNKFFTQNIAEAKKLVQAAGISGKLQTKFYYPSNGYGAVYQQTVQIVAQMLNDTGVVDAKLTPVDYQSEYIPKIHFGGERIGAWDGVALTPAAQGDEAGHQLQVQYHSRGAATRQPPGEDPKLDAMIEAQLQEKDTAKRVRMIQDIQRYMPETMMAVPVFYQAAGYQVGWPWVGNLTSARARAVPQSDIYPHLWFDKATYDKTKP